MTRKLGIFGLSAIGAIAALGYSAASDAGVPGSLTEQGRLLDAQNNPVSGGVQFVFSIYQGATGGSPIWTETQTITLDSGYFSARLGDVTAIGANVFDGTVRYLGIKVATDAEMSPRQPIVSVP